MSRARSLGGYQAARIPLLNWNDAIVHALRLRREGHSFRQRIAVGALDSTHLEVAGRRLVNFASNDYLGLTHHPNVIAAMAEAVRGEGAGSGASALVSGYTQRHESAERAIAQWKGTESAVLLGSGYAANVAAIQTLAAIGGAEVRFLVDKLAHASLIDGVRSVAGERGFRIFPHNHLVKLRRLLMDSPAGAMNVVVTESIFSMDGEGADLAGLAALKNEFPFLLLLDEAHGTGVFGPLGRGYAAELQLQSAVDVSVLTLSKAMGIAGGAVCGSQDFCEGVVNFGRAYIYSTSVPPGLAAGAEAAISVMQAEPGRQERLREISLRVRGQLRERGFEMGGVASPIIPVVVGEAAAALRAAEELLAAGFLVIAIRPPTVARGTSRLRISLSCDHSDAEITQLLEAVGKLRLS